MRGIEVENPSPRNFLGGITHDKPARYGKYFVFVVEQYLALGTRQLAQRY